MAGLLDALPPQPPDPILALIDLHRADPRAHKLDLGVGVYRDASGETPVFAAVKAAEREITAQERSKNYLGAAGNTGFTAAILQLVLGDSIDASGVAAIQTPGGTGSLRLAMELLHKARPAVQVWLGTPAYPNHAPIFAAAGIAVREFPYFDVARQALTFDAARDALRAANAGDVVLLHGACHNPTGADLAPAQWQGLTDVVLERELVPFVDVAYHGLHRGLDADAAGLRAMLALVPEWLLSYSCSKTFGLYRERTGALYVKSRDAARRDTVFSNLAALARVNWSLSPDHGAELVRRILESPALRANWETELASMRARLNGLREALGGAHPALRSVATQSGLFSMLSLTPEQTRRLREEHGVYLTGSGRINVAGLVPETVGRFASALQAVGFGA